MYQLSFRTTNVLLYPLIKMRVTPSYIFDRNLDMVYELNGRENISIIGNVITLQIILRNKILGNNNLFKVTST